MVEHHCGIVHDAAGDPAYRCAVADLQRTLRNRHAEVAAAAGQDHLARTRLVDAAVEDPRIGEVIRAVDDDRGCRIVGEGSTEIAARSPVADLK